MRYYIDLIIGMIGASVAYLLGGWNTMIQTLLLFMVLDYLTGVIAAGVFHKSTKSASGALSSKAGFKGLAKKMVILIVVCLAYHIDIMLKLNNALYSIVVIAYIANEAISILENAIAMGIPIPKKLEEAIETMKGD